MKIILAAAIVCILQMFNALNSYAQVDSSGIDTILIVKSQGEVFELTAPLLYYANYQWTLPNNDILYGATIQMSFSSVGEYFINCRGYENCDAEKTAVVKITIIPGEADETINYISLYPNPVSGTGPFLAVNSTINNANGSIVIAQTGGAVFYTSIVNINTGSNLYDLTTAVQNLNGFFTMTFTSNTYVKSYNFYKQ